MHSENALNSAGNRSEIPADILIKAKEDYIRLLNVVPADLQKLLQEIESEEQR